MESGILVWFGGVIGESETWVVKKSCTESRRKIKRFKLRWLEDSDNDLR
jgi:hypothetical protein